MVELIKDKNEINKIINEKIKNKKIVKTNNYLLGIEHKIIADKEISCKIAFSDEIGTSFNLIGRETVFDKFLITFNEKSRELFIKPI